jgi:mRNA interferase MazF
MSLSRWDLAWAGLDPTQGHEQAGRRPVLVVSSDVIGPAIGLAAVVPLTTWRQGRRVYPTEVLLPDQCGGLAAPSLVLAHQLRTVAVERLSPPFGRLDDPALRDAVTHALRLWLDLQE